MVGTGAERAQWAKQRGGASGIARSALSARLCEFPGDGPGALTAKRSSCFIVFGQDSVRPPSDEQTAASLTGCKRKSMNLPARLSRDCSAFFPELHENTGIGEKNLPHDKVFVLHRRSDDV